MDKKQFRQIEQQSKKLVTMHKALYSKDNIDRLCIKKKNKRIRQHWGLRRGIDTSTGKYTKNPKINHSSQ